ncbi:MAG: hypothetical protein ACI9G1_006114, partial [Pirellulaceae bacterium]
YTKTYVFNGPSQTTTPSCNDCPPDVGDAESLQPAKFAQPAVPVDFWLEEDRHNRYDSHSSDQLPTSR